MTPGEFTLPFYRGAAWSYEFRFKNADGSAFDLTGRGPFTLVIERLTDSRDLVSVEATSDYDATGVMEFALTQAQTRLLPIGKVLVGIRDNSGLPFAVGEVAVYKFPT